MSVTITRDDWLRAMDEAGMSAGLVDDQDAVSVLEFAEMMGCTFSTAQSRLASLERMGKATRTKKRVVNTYGRRIDVKAYRLV